MVFRFQTTIRREGWYYLLILVVVLGGALFKEVNLLLILAGMLIGPVLLNWQAVRTNLLGLRVDRKLPQGLAAGDRLSVSLSLTNARRRLGAWAVVVEEQIRRITGDSANNDDRLKPLHPAVLFPYVPVGQSRKGAYRGRLLERGRYEFGPLRISTQFPFGLFSRTITAGDIESLIVLPRLGRLTEGWAARRLEAIAGADRRRRRAGPDGDFYGVRQWHSGDGRRLIHWRSSARLGKLVVRQFEQPQSRDAAVVLDLWQPKRPSAEHLENVELAVSFAATVLADLCRKGGSVVSLAISKSGPECLGGPVSPALLQGLMEQLAIVEARDDDALPTLLAHALQRITAGTEIVVASTRPIDLTDTARFAAIWSDPILLERSRRLRCIDTSSENLAEFFQVEE
jgi:uncharacterized protein (DUF58 family)